MLRAVQFYNCRDYGVSPAGEDGFAPDCTPYTGVRRLSSTIVYKGLMESCLTRPSSRERPPERSLTPNQSEGRSPFEFFSRFYRHTCKRMAIAPV